MDQTQQSGDDVHVPPIEIKVWWCPSCDSNFLHYMGTRHIRQRGKGGECWGRLKELQFFR